MTAVRILYMSIFIGLLVSCSDSSVKVQSDPDNLSTQLRQTILHATNQDATELLLPNSDALDSIPQDPNNPITEPKVRLGKLLYHDTAFSTAGRSAQTGTWSCATCHHAAAGFKSGVAQGIGEGGLGFGVDGSRRVLSDFFDAGADADDPLKPDLQPLASPSILNTAFQDVMLWNGQFGNTENGIINAGIAGDILMTPDTPKASNELGLSGLEIQAIAGQAVHRINVSDDSIILTNETYRTLYDAAFPGSTDDVNVNAGKAIAAYERTVLANRAPFQLWLRGETTAMTDAELRGGIVFFGKGNCSSCHQGPALSSKVGATAEELFMAVGFADFDPHTNNSVHGPVTDNDKNGRGGFTGVESDNLKFKIPQLYNLADADVFGHGASFSTIRDVLKYKNRAAAQKRNIQQALDHRFVPLQLTASELDNLEAFIATGLRDPDLMRYQPDTVPSGSCVVVVPLMLHDDFPCVDF